MIVGQVATFTVDAYPGQVMRGTVREIRSAPIVVQNVVNYNAVIAVDNPELKLKPGMTATVSILVAQRAERIENPQSGTALSAATDAAGARAVRHGVPAAAGRSTVASNGRGQPSRKSWQTTPKVWTLTLGRGAVARCCTSRD